MQSVNVKLKPVPIGEGAWCQQCFFFDAATNCRIKNSPLSKQGGEFACGEAYRDDETNVIWIKS